MTKQDQSLVLIVGDQLSVNLSSLRQADKASDVVFMAEVWPEASNVRHHQKKVVLVFSAMRHFAEELRNRGWKVDYVKLDDLANTQSLTTEVARAQMRHGIDHVVMTEPSEWRVREALAHIEMLEDTRFICNHGTFNQWAKNRRELRMEFFYRDMRRQTKLLMNGDEPEGGQWNFDADNRKPAKGAEKFKAPLKFKPDAITLEVIALVEKRFSHHFGTLHPFWFAVKAEEAHEAFQLFLNHGLARFGETQDAMLEGEYFLNHAMISAYINLGLLDPLVVCRAVEKRYREGLVPLASAEGFIRQIIGWREYVRGIYWLKMPDYAQTNALEAKRPLPDLYWSGETKMNCMKQAIQQTREEAYAHHIQRLMITGNFALLAGFDPNEVHEWYLAVYADAFEWVEMPNTIGMALHADGGAMASKPYAASGNYINKMSNYCKGCAHDVKQRLGEDACPFNALYWNFIGTHQKRFSKNPRMAQIAASYSRFEEQEKSAVHFQAQRFLDGLKPYVES
jgi:deoxyribodipyrimidine photolyase-related protein